MQIRQCFCYPWALKIEDLEDISAENFATKWWASLPKFIHLTLVRSQPAPNALALNHVLHINEDTILLCWGL